MPAARAAVPRGEITALTRPGGRLTRQMATGRLLASMAHFLDEQARLNRKWIEAQLMTRSTAGLQRGALRTVGLDVQRESTLEQAFRRASMDRISAQLPAVLAKPIYSRADRAARWEAINSLLERELRFARQRQEALSSRVLRAVERARVAQGSPEGAFWRLGPTKTHTPDCVAMSDRFHPWPVLARVHPPLHPGCACTLHAKSVAVKRGWMGEADVPGLDAAIRHASQAVPEGVAEAWLEELAIREALAERGFDASLIPLADAFDVGERRDFRGRWAGEGGRRRRLKAPKVLAWHEPPAPTGKAGERKGGGMTAVGITNTKLGDAVEHALTALGFEDAHPGRRQGPFDLRFGENAYEVKAVSQSASEYKAKPKRHEVEGKLAHAKQHGLKPHVMIVVYEPGAKRVHAYVKEGVGAYRLTGPEQGWSYIGSVALDLGSAPDPVAALREAVSDLLEGGSSGSARAI